MEKMLPLLDTPWADVTGYGFALALILYLAFRLIGQEKSSHQYKSRLRHGWHTYLDALSEQLARLRGIRTLLMELRLNPKKEPELACILDRLYRKINPEIKRIENQLRTLTSTTDQQWINLRIEYAPAPAFRQDFADLIQETLNRYSRKQLETLRVQWTRKMELRYQRRISGLKGEIEELRLALEQAKKKAGKMQDTLAEREGAGDVSGVETTAMPEADEQEIAARFMSTLGGDLDLEAINTEIAKVDGELHYCRNQLSNEEMEPERQKELKSRQLWMEQVLRWWKVQRKIRQQRMLLDGQTTDAMAGDEMADDLMEFQDMEARNREMRNKLSDVNSENRKLLKQMELLDMEQADAEKLRATLGQLETAYRQTQREMNSLEQMVENLESEAELLRLRARKVEKMEEKLLDAENQRDRMKQELAETRSEMEKMAMEQDMAQTDSMKELKELKAALEKGEVEGMVPEQEVVELQMAYDDLNSQLLQAKSSVKQLEEDKVRLKERIEQMEIEKKQMMKQLEIIPDDSEEVAGLKAEKAKLQLKLEALEQQVNSGEVSGMVPEQEVMDLQMEYDKVNAELKKMRNELAQKDLELEAAQAEMDQLGALCEQLQEQAGNPESP